MTNDQFWKPDKQTRSAIRRGDKVCKEYLSAMLRNMMHFGQLDLID